MARWARILTRKLVVNPRLQYGIVAYTVAFVTVLTSINLYCQTILFADGQVTEVRRFIVIGLFIICTFIFAILFGLHLTNQIAGPIYRLKQHMKETAEAEKPTPMQFRKTDFFSEIVPEYNKIIERLKKNET